MTAEKPPVPKIEKEMGKPLELSLDTAKASLEVATKPSADSLEKLTDSLKKDLRESGVDVGDIDSKQIAKNLVPIADPPIEIPKIPSVGELFDTLKYVQNTYGMDKYNNQLAAAGGAFMGLRVLDAVAQYFTYGVIEKITGNANQLKALADIASALPALGSVDKQKRNTFMKEALVKTSGIWAPIIFQLTARQIEKPAKKVFEKFIKGMSETMNKRVTESLLMGEYAFLSDRPPGEIYDIVERGKMATVDLVDTFYGKLLPNLTSIAASTLPQIQINKWSWLFGVARWPSLYAYSKNGIERTFQDRVKLLKKQDELDARIASTLVNLEIAQVSGKTDEGAKELADIMKIREELLSSQRVGKSAQEQKEKNVNFVFEKGAPWAVVLLEVMQGYKKAFEHPYKRYSHRGIKSDGEWHVHSNLIKSIPYDPRLISGSIINAIFKQAQFKNVQMENSFLANDIANLYVNRIMPDLADIREMEMLLGPWNELDRPDGPRELARKPASELLNLDISVKDLNVMGILRDVSFDIKQGEFVAIRSEKGEGKTTLLRSLLGLYPAQSGEVTIGGVGIDGVKKFGPDSIHAQFGYANQTPGFIETMTLKDNLLLWNKGTVTDEKMTGVMTELGLEKLIPRLSEKGSFFSGGEKKLLSIVRALLTDPKVLFLDEPTAHLDPASIDRLVQVLQRIKQTRPETTIIAVTHDADFAKYTDRTINLGELNKKPDLADNQVFEAKAKAGY